MKCIYPDNIESVSADEENAGYLVENLLDYHPKKPWKGTSRDAVITAVVSGAGACAVIATNAVSATLTLSSGQTLELAPDLELAADLELDSSGDSDVTSVALLPGDISGCAWFDFAARAGSFTATLLLVANAGEIIQAGILRVGTCNEFEDPEEGLKEGLKDYSLMDELNNGATDIIPRDVVSTFRGRLMEDRAVGFKLFMRTVARAIGSLPQAWLITESLTDSDWIVFARYDGMPDGSHDLPLDSAIEFSLLEVL